MPLVSNFHTGPVQFAPGHILLPTGGLWGYVHNSGSGGLDRLPPGMLEAPLGFHTTVQAALATARANRGDTIIVLPGHVETLSIADAWSNIVAGTTILGLGQGHDRPTFHWSVAASTVILDVANVTLDNLILNLAGDPTLTTAITGDTTGSIQVQARGITIKNCIINDGVDANQIITIGIATTDAGDFFTFENNRVWNGILTAAGVHTSGAAAEIAAAGTFLRLVGSSGSVIRKNHIVGALATDADGLLELLTTPCIDILVEDNYWYANGSGNTTCVDTNTAVAHTGVFARNLMTVDADASAETTVFSRSGTNDFALIDNYLVSNNNERGLVIGTAST